MFKIKSYQGNANQAIKYNFTFIRMDITKKTNNRSQQGSGETGITTHPDENVK